MTYDTDPRVGPIATKATSRPSDQDAEALDLLRGLIDDASQDEDYWDYRTPSDMRTTLGKIAMGRQYVAHLERSLSDVEHQIQMAAERLLKSSQVVGIPPMPDPVTEYAEPPQMGVSANAKTYPVRYGA